jgi:hypothetical protein
MQSVSPHSCGTSSGTGRPSVWKLPNGRRCPVCHRFGIYAPGQVKCCTCLGWLPLIFVTVVVNGGEA